MKTDKLINTVAEICNRPELVSLLSNETTALHGMHLAEKHLNRKTRVPWYDEKTQQMLTMPSDLHYYCYWLPWVTHREVSGLRLPDGRAVSWDRTLDISASWQQRAEAFVRLFGKWEDDE